MGASGLGTASHGSAVLVCPQPQCKDMTQGYGLIKKKRLRPLTETAHRSFLVGLSPRNLQKITAAMAESTVTLHRGWMGGRWPDPDPLWVGGWESKTMLRDRVPKLVCMHSITKVLVRPPFPQARTTLSSPSVCPAHHAYISRSKPSFGYCGPSGHGMPVAVGLACNLLCPPTSVGHLAHIIAVLSCMGFAASLVAPADTIACNCEGYLHILGIGPAGFHLEGTQDPR